MRTFIFFICLVFFACKKVSIGTEEVINSLVLSPTTVQADGSSVIDVAVKINSNAEASKRKVVLETSSGSFTANNQKTITVDALYENSELVARTTIKAPNSPGNLVVTARPETRTAYNDFIIKDSVQVGPSVPNSISLSASAFSVLTGYQNDVQITGILKNQNGKNVSAGIKVLFEDIYPNGTPVGGRFRQVQNSSNESSTVSAFYAPGYIAPGTNFFVRATVLNSTGGSTAIKDSVLLTVIQ
jgi:hypothetical protein